MRGGIDVGASLARVGIEEVRCICRMATILVDPSDDRSAANLETVITVRSAAHIRPSIRESHETGDAGTHCARRGRAAAVATSLRAWFFT